MRGAAVPEGEFRRRHKGGPKRSKNPRYGPIATSFSLPLRKPNSVVLAQREGTWNGNTATN